MHVDSLTILYYTWASLYSFWLKFVNLNRFSANIWKIGKNWFKNKNFLNCTNCPKIRRKSTHPSHFFKILIVFECFFCRIICKMSLLWIFFNFKVFIIFSQTSTSVLVQLWSSSSNNRFSWFVTLSLSTIHPPGFSPFWKWKLILKKLNYFKWNSFQRFLNFWVHHQACTFFGFYLLKNWKIEKFQFLFCGQNCNYR